MISNIRETRLTLLVASGLIAVLCLAACRDENKAPRHAWAECAYSIIGDAPHSVEDSERYFRHVETVWKEHYELFERQPNLVYHKAHSIRHVWGGTSGRGGIIIAVQEPVDPAEQAPEDRMPACIDGVLTQYLVPPVPPSYLWLPSEPGDPNRYLVPPVSSISGAEEESTHKTRVECNRSGPWWAPRPDEEWHAHASYVKAVWIKYRDLFERQPTQHFHGRYPLRHGDGFTASELELLYTGGIVIAVLEPVDPARQAPEDRVPACIEGVPTQIIVTTKNLRFQ